MATISTTVRDWWNNTITCTVTYTVTTAGDGTTVAFSSKTYSDSASIRDASDTATFTFKVGSTTVKSGSVWSSVSGGGSRKVSATHEAQSVQVELHMSVHTNSKTIVGLSSVPVSVPARYSYTVSYDANGGSNAPSSQTKWYGETLTLSSTKPTRANYVFRRWNTSTADSGTAYDPGATYTGNAALTLRAIWNPLIQYNANGSGVGGMPVTQTKTFGTDITLSPNTPSRPGYAFAGWYANEGGTGTRYAPGQTYSGNAALTLYAKWEKVPDAPAISSMTVVRCNSSGTNDDTGTYCKVTARWSVDTTSDTVSSNTGTVTGTIRADGSSSTRTISWSSGASGTSGTATAILSGIDTDTQYLVTVTVTDKVTSTSRTDVLTRAEFVLDFRAGGAAIGIGSAAPQSGLEVGWDAQFDGNVTVLGNVLAANLVDTYSYAIENIFEVSGTWSVSSAQARTWGHLCQVTLVVSNSSALAAGASQAKVGTLTSNFRPKSAVAFGTTTGGGEITAAGSVNFRPFVDVAANSRMYIAVAYII